MLDTIQAHLRPVHPQHQPAEFVGVGEVAPIQAEVIEEPTDETSLEDGMILAGRFRLVGLVLRSAVVQKESSLVMAGEEEFPMCVRRLLQVVRQDVGVRLRCRRWRHRPAASADHTHDRGAVLDVVVELGERRIGIVLLSEVILDLDLDSPGPQVTRHQRTRLTKLAADRRDEHVEYFGPTHALKLPSDLTDRVPAALGSGVDHCTVAKANVGCY